MMDGLTWQQFLSPVWLSLKVSICAGAIAFAAGVAAAWGMRRSRFRGKTAVETLFLLPLVLPPTVVGFVLLMLLGRNGWIGRLAEWLFARPIVFTWGAAVLAAAVVAFPLVYQTMKAGFASVDRELEEVGRTLGAGEWQVLSRISLPLARRSLAAAFVLGFARALGEFGATLMVAGSIPGRTQTVPTAIYVAVDSGHMSLAWGWTSAVILISFILLWIVTRKKE